MGQTSRWGGRRLVDAIPDRHDAGDARSHFGRQGRQARLACARQGRLVEDGRSRASRHLRGYGVAAAAKRNRDTHNALFPARFCRFWISAADTQPGRPIAVGPPASRRWLCRPRCRRAARRRACAVARGRLVRRLHHRLWNFLHDFLRFRFRLRRGRQDDVRLGTREEAPAPGSLAAVRPPRVRPLSFADPA